MSDTSLTITTQRVLDAAKQCPDAERVLKTLFPEVFKKDLRVDCSRLSLTGPPDGIQSLRLSTGWLLLETLGSAAPSRDLSGHGLFLSSAFNWTLKGQVLIPTKKAER